MPTKHRFISPLNTNQSPTTLVTPSGWNDTHLSMPQMIPLLGVSLTLTNMAAGAAELTGNDRTRADLTQVNEVKLGTTMGVVGAAQSFMQAHYASGTQANWADLTNMLAMSGLNYWETAWTAIPPGARTDAFIRIMISGGNGTADPQVRNIFVQVR